MAGEDLKRGEADGDHLRCPRPPGDALAEPDETGDQHHRERDDGGDEEAVERHPVGADEERVPGEMKTLASGEVVHGFMNLPAFIGIVAVTALLTLGVSESATVNNIVVAIKVTVVVAFIVIGVFYVNPELWSPLIPEQVPAPPPGSDMSMGGQIWAALGNVVTGHSRESAYGIGGLIAAASTIFFAYIGFEAVSTAGAEAKNPARDMPIGILGSLVICTILYILTCAVLVGIVPYQELNVPGPDRHGGRPDGPAVVCLPREGRRLRRPVVGDAGPALWPDPHLLHDGARRPAAAHVRQDQPQDEDAGAQHDPRRHRSRLALPASRVSTSSATPPTSVRWSPSC